jgi:N-formylmaleamate deformylase
MSRSVPDPALDDLARVPATSVWTVRDGVRLHALDYGGDGTPLLVLPGITSPAVTWDFVVRPLVGPFRPVVLDLRGRGLSGLAGAYGLEEYAQDAEAVVAQLGLEGVVVLGHSLGARIGAVLATRGVVTPAGTILVDPPLSGPDRGPYPTSREAFQTQLDEGHAGTTADEVRRFYPKWPDAELALRARWLPTCDPTAVLATYDDFTRDDFLIPWAAVPEPATLIRGAESPVVTAQGADDLIAARAATTDVPAIPGAGHMVAWDAPEDFMDALRSALRPHEHAPQNSTRS